MLKYFWNIMSKSVSVGRVSLLVWLPSRREKACLFFMTRLCARLGGKESLFSTETANRREGSYTPKKRICTKGECLQKTVNHPPRLREPQRKSTNNGKYSRCCMAMSFRKEALVIPRLRSSRGNPSPNEVADCHAPFIFVQGARNDLLN